VNVGIFEVFLVERQKANKRQQIKTCSLIECSKNKNRLITDCQGLCHKAS
jgi:hypothetical protein